MLILNVTPQAIFHYTETKTLPIQFPFFGLDSIMVSYAKASDLNTIIPLTYGQDFTVAGVIDGDINDNTNAFRQGTVTLTSTGASNLISGDYILVYRQTKPEQGYQYTELDNFPAKSHENALGKSIALIQEIQQYFSRVIMTSPLATETPQNLLDAIFSARNRAETAAIDSETSATDSQASANRAWDEANRSEQEKILASLEADRAATEADRARDAANGTIHKSRVFNVRGSWAITADQTADTIINLPESYFPTRNHMVLFYNGVLCEIESATSDAMYQYSEVGSVDVLSNLVVIRFPVYAGDRFDMWAVASGVLQDLDTLEQTLADAKAFLLTVQTTQLTGMAIPYFGEFTQVGSLWYPKQFGTNETMIMYGLCDGSVYPAIRGGFVQTPDLRDMFVKGSSIADIGVTGGSAEHNHAGTTSSNIANVSINWHALTLAQIPWHTHYYEAATSQRTDLGGGSRWATNGLSGKTTGSAGGSEGHTHGVTQSGHTHTTTVAKANSDPRFHKTTYIMSL